MEIKKIIGYGLESFSIPTTEEPLERLTAYIKELERWNKRINLTRIKEAGRIIEELLFDAFFLHSYMKDMDRVIDVGSGSGIISIPIAILNKGMEVFAVDMDIKRFHFQRHIKRMLGLKNLLPLHAKVEELEGIKVDGLVAKAFGSIKDVIQKGGGHLKRGGLAFILKGRGEEPSTFPDFLLKESIEYTLPSSDKAYRLFIYMSMH
jgi:16S rRNA (guanine527-N7)-methyltransferase